ncbi:YchJ family protein [Corynebacterium incognita]|uniref:UPF0225 protein H0194_00145 n=1 Tax=Corynebacterium incognita TaxID=2754725 RepID=A0A7G7CPL4_9CORY|nr:YchJ family protein [Corynebacterium incognita]QNE89530.1 YchJ family protein [Corynebacterium incognita]
MTQPQDSQLSDLAGRRCPCGSGFNFAECCGQYHAGKPAPTAEKLMRSRFSAFALGDSDYLLRTWDPETRPATLVLDVDQAGVPAIRFYRLDIIDTSAGGPLDDTGVVEFEAFYKGVAVGSQRERSTFVRRDGQWLYSTGTEGA